MDLYIKTPKEGDRLIKRVHEKFQIDTFERKKNKVDRWMKELKLFGDEDLEFLEEEAKEDIFREKKLQEALALQLLFL